MAWPDPEVRPEYGNKFSLILSDIAIGLFAFYVAFVVADILPIRVLDPLWMITLAGTLCNTSTIALAGLAFLHLAAGLSPSSGPTAARRLWCSRLAAWAAIGFLMLLPLIGYANWRGISNIRIANHRNIAVINKKAAEITYQILQASTPRDLQGRMAKVQGPVLPSESLVLPLENLKKQSLASVKQSVKVFENQAVGPFAEAYMPIYKQSLRAAALAFVAAFSFAAGAWNPRTNTTFLHSIISLFKSACLKSRSVLRIFAEKLKQFKRSMAARTNQAEAREGLKLMKDNQRKIHLQREKEIRRNDAQFRKLRERLKSHAEQKAKRKDRER